MDLLQMPVTLVVKAPNQKIADQTVECALDWTIKKLKSHLSSVYPTSPEEHQQRIIYSGQLLLDHVQLKDVLRQYEPDQTIHTVHLVCSMPDINTTKSTSNSNSSTTDTMATNEGVRQRRPVTTTTSSNHSNTSSEPANTTSQSSQAFSSPQSSEHRPTDTTQAFNGAGQFFNPVTSMGMMPPQAAMMPGFPYSPEQMLWFQQMYAQQMAQYMQYYQGVPQANQGQNSFDQPPANQNVAAGQAANQQAAPERDQPMVMNAAGDAVMDDDEENGNRDWLDWLYTCSRFVVLLSIVYFYSTFSRFMLVLGSFFALYLYQQGWFQIQRREVQNRRNEQQRNDRENVQNAENVLREEDNGETDRNSEEESSSTEDPNSTTDGASAVQEPPSPGYIRVAFSFFTTFFTSLIPQPPAPVNVN